MNYYERIKAAFDQLTEPLLPDIPFLIYRSGSSVVSDPCVVSKSHNYQSFVERMLTYNTHPWIQHPHAALALARHGFMKGEGNTTVCSICQVEMSPYPWVDQPRFLCNMALRAHSKYCSWKVYQTPKDYFDIQGSPSELCKSLKIIWKDLFEMDTDLPCIKENTWRKMGFNENINKIFLECFGTTVTEREISALILALCGWVRDSGKSIKCKFCCRVIGTWNFHTLGGENGATPTLTKTENVFQILYKAVRSRIVGNSESLEDGSSVQFSQSRTPLLNIRDTLAQSRNINSAYGALKRAKKHALKMITKEKECKEFAKQTSELELGSSRKNGLEMAVHKTEGKRRKWDEKACKGIRHETVSRSKDTDAMRIIGRRFLGDCNESSHFKNVKTNNKNGPVSGSITETNKSALWGNPLYGKEVEFSERNCGDGKRTDVNGVEATETMASQELTPSGDIGYTIAQSNIGTGCPSSISTDCLENKRTGPQCVKTISEKEWKLPKIVSVSGFSVAKFPRDVSLCATVKTGTSKHGGGMSGNVVGGSAPHYQKVVHDMTLSAPTTIEREEELSKCDDDPIGSKRKSLGRKAIRRFGGNVAGREEHLTPPPMYRGEHNMQTNKTDKISALADICMKKECNGGIENINFCKHAAVNFSRSELYKIITASEAEWNQWESGGTIIDNQNSIAQSNGKEEECEELECDLSEHISRVGQKFTDGKEISEDNKNIATLNSTISLESFSNGCMHDGNGMTISNDVDDPYLGEANIRTDTVKTHKLMTKLKSHSQVDKLRTARKHAEKDNEIQTNVASKKENEKDSAATILRDGGDQELGDLKSSVVVSDTSVEKCLQSAEPSGGTNSESLEVCSSDTDTSNPKKRKLIDDGNDEGILPKKTCVWDNLEKTYFHPELDHRFWCFWRIKMDKNKGWEDFLKKALEGCKLMLAAHEQQNSLAALKLMENTVAGM